MDCESNLKVALVVPKINLSLCNSAPPLGLGYIASYLRKTLPSVEIRIFDGATGEDAEKAIREFQPQIVGVTATTPQAPAAYRLADTVRQNWPNILMVMGGVHATVLPQEALEHFDIVVVGEGEKTFSQIVQRFLQDKLPQKGVVEGEPIDNLDDIPSPSFDLLNVRWYLQRGLVLPGTRTPMFGLVTSRGCPYHCAFCYNSYRKTKVRYFSARRIVEEILFLRKEYGISSVFFNDDEFLINNQRIKTLAELFEETGISKWLKWGCQARATTITAPLLKTIKSMGCVALSVGFESGTERLLHYLKSGSATLASNERALDIADSFGILMGGSFIFGTPTETLEEMKYTFEWVVNHPKLKFYYTLILAPFPGTKVWNLCMERGALPEKVNYEMLTPDINSSLVEENMYPVPSVPLKTFVRFMRDINRASWFINEVRLKPAILRFVFFLGFPTSWKVFASHPQVIVKEFTYVVKAQIMHRKTAINQVV